MQYFRAQDEDIEGFQDAPPPVEFVPPFIDELRDILVKAAEAQ